MISVWESAVQILVHSVLLHNYWVDFSAYMNYRIRDFSAQDKAEVNAVALAAFQEFQSAYSDWPTLAAGILQTSAMAEFGELIVAACAERVLGIVVYVGPGRPKNEFFDAEWPVIRMLAVDPAARGTALAALLPRSASAVLNGTALRLLRSTHLR